MKKKWFKAITSLLLCLCFPLAACGGGTEGGSGGGNNGGNENNGGSGGDSVQTIHMYTSVNIIEFEALQAAAYAYEDYQYSLGNNISIDLGHNTDDPDGLQRTLRNLISTGAIKEPTIAPVSPLPEYHGTDKLVDLSGYLEEPNPYSPDYDTWMDSLEEDAYRPIRAGSTVTIPGVSYSANYSCAFYNKSAMLDIMGDDPLVDETGTIDTSSPDFTWEWMLKALNKARNVGGTSGKKFTNPLAISRNEQACGQVNFNLVTTLINMYLDQYFRDFTEDVHSQEGDYSYVPGIDAEWTYDEQNPMVDYESNYSYNLNKVVDNYFNHSAEFGPESARYAEMMQNLYDLLQYSNPDDSYNDCFDKFNRTTLTYNKGGSYGDADMKLFYFETLGYIRTYRDAHKSVTSGTTTYPSAQWINDTLGWFLMPAMPSELEGVADNVRPTGGPLEGYGALSTGSAALDEIAIDFLRWLTSPMGQENITAHYVSQNAPQMMRQLVKGVNIDPKVDFTKVANQVKGDIGFSPYNIFGMGSGMSTCHVEGTSDLLGGKVATLLSSYFKGSVRTWGENGKGMLDLIKSGFKDYAAQYKLIYTDPAKVSEATSGLKNNPFNVTD